MKFLYMPIDKKGKIQCHLSPRRISGYVFEIGKETEVKDVDEAMFLGMSHIGIIPAKSKKIEGINKKNLKPKLIEDSEKIKKIESVEELTEDSILEHNMKILTKQAEEIVDGKKYQDWVKYCAEYDIKLEKKEKEIVREAVINHMVSNELNKTTDS